MLVLCLALWLALRLVPPLERGLGYLRDKPWGSRLDLMLVHLLVLRLVLDSGSRKASKTEQNLAPNLEQQMVQW